VSIWFRNDNRLPQARLAVVSYVIVGMIGVLLLGFWKLQVIDSDRYGVMAERNRVRSIPIIAPRGRMLDRDGRVLVDNYPSFSVLLLRDDPALVEKNLPAISDGLGVPLADLRDQLANTKNLPKFQPIVIKPEATKGDVAFIESHRADIPLLEMLMVHRRRYLPDGFMGHASGYVGEVSEQQIEDSDGKLRPGDFAGKTGSAQTISNALKARLGAAGKANFKDNGWFVGVEPRRNPEIVVCTLLEEGEHGYLAARTAAKVIKAFVEKEQRAPAKMAGTRKAGIRVEVGAVWTTPDTDHDDGRGGDKETLQAGHFFVDIAKKSLAMATAAPGISSTQYLVPSSAKLR